LAEFDLFANQLLEEAKRFLEKSKEGPDAAAEAANLHAALLLGFCALEAHVNSICEEFSIVPALSAHEKSLLLEKDVKLEDGEFRLQEGLKMARLEDRIEFLFSKFSSKPMDHSAVWWSQLSTAIDLRNKLTHAKTITPITRTSISGAIQGIIDTLDALYQAVYKRKFPPVTQGLHSGLTF
jgi:hypothetical protein